MQKFLYLIITIIIMIINNYCTSAGWIWVGYNLLISNKREWNNWFIKNDHNISRILPDFISKNNRFSAGFEFWADEYSYHIWTACYDGSYTMMAEPVRALELHYATIQFLIIMIMIIIAIMMIINLCFEVQSDSVELLSSLNLSCPHSVSRFTLDNLYQ